MTHRYAAHEFPGNLVEQGQTAQHFHRDRVAEHNAEILGQREVGKADTKKADGKPTRPDRSKSTRRTTRAT